MYVMGANVSVSMLYNIRDDESIQYSRPRKEG